MDVQRNQRQKSLGRHTNLALGWIDMPKNGDIRYRFSLILAIGVAFIVTIGAAFRIYFHSGQDEFPDGITRI
ncbi:uncharacterized protein BO87DRAFT_243025 [Aspergillus neoniger CBS 115656]|uniref:Uncharacterized protein n=1 Tax=Aspergillus neoniger (strain CBS 115656) TaxID=1448310 RepID=A0A318Y5S0_ASPNB|nr:hypothetical protein BO87DRAFT_243025 [Aspergillus neoniger CBS 115656]PYH28170.1 hypothetical protein BO87DRAFT_243025 [Aspergillus neoniger CBS 115656]